MCVCACVCVCVCACVCVCVCVRGRREVELGVVTHFWEAAFNVARLRAWRAAGCSPDELPRLAWWRVDRLTDLSASDAQLVPDFVRSMPKEVHPVWLEVPPGA